MARDFCNRCQLVVAPSGPVESYLAEIGVNVPVAVIPTGNDLEELKKADPGWLRDNYRIGPQARVLLFVGRLGKEKNLLFLLQAFYLAQQASPELALVIAGGGPQEEQLRSRCRTLGLESKVTFTGLLPRRQLIHCYAGADLFVFPSVTETQGLVIGEAKSAALPVVAINATGSAEMVLHGEDGLLTEESPERFAAAVIKLLQDRPLYERMSRCARHNAAALSAGAAAEKMIDRYAELLEIRRPSPIPHQPI